MSDVSTQPIVAGAPATAPAAAPAPVTAAPPEAAPAPVAEAPAAAALDPNVAALMGMVTTLTNELASIKSQLPAAPAVVVPENPPSPVNLFVPGQMVKFAWNDPYDGPSERTGLVLEQFPDEGQGAQSAIAWFDSVSGPIGDHQLSAV